MTKPLLDLDNAREPEQLAQMEKIIEAGHCPFCMENLPKYANEPIKETEHWVLLPNKWPYRHTSLHMIVIYKQHAETISEVDPAAGEDLFKLMQWVEKEYNVPGGAIAVRFGDTDFSAGSVNHLHAHLIQPDIHHPNYLDKPVRLKIGKTKNIKPRE